MSEEFPEPPKDFAARFPKQGGEAQPPAAAAPVTPESAPPYDFLGLIGAACAAPLKPWAIYAEAASRPEPGFASLAAVQLCGSVLFFSLNLLHAALTHPHAVSGQPPERFALAALAALLLAFFGGFIAAAAFHCVALLCGGTGSFRRSYEAVALAAALVPLQALVLWVAGPMQLLPLLLTAVLAAAALEKLHQATPLAARSACAALALALGGGAWLVARQLESALAPYTQLVRSLQQPQPTPSAFPMPEGAPPEAAQAMAALQTALANMPTASTSTRSGLDLIGGSGGGDQSAAPTAYQPPPPSPELIQMQTQGANFMESASKLMESEASKARTPQEKKQIEEMAAMVKSFSGMMQPGKKITPEEQKRMQDQLTNTMNIMTQQIQSAAQAQQRNQKLLKQRDAARSGQ